MIEVLILVGAVSCIIALIWGSQSKKDYFPMEIKWSDDKNVRRSRWIIQSSRKLPLCQTLFGNWTYETDCEDDVHFDTFYSYEDACACIESLNSIVTCTRYNAI